MSTLSFTSTRKYNAKAAKVLAALALKRQMAAEDLGERLQHRRAELGLTQEQLADRMEGVTLRAVQRWLNGETVPQDRNLHKLAAALEMDPKELIVELVPAHSAADEDTLARIERKLDRLANSLARLQVELVTEEIQKRPPAKKPRARPRRRASGGTR